MFDASKSGMTASDVLVAVTTLSFDIAGLEMYLPLLVGGKLVVASRDVTMDGRLLMQLLEQSGATIMQATPTTWRVLLESGWKGDSKLKVLVGGEALPARPWHASSPAAAALLETVSDGRQRKSARRFCADCMRPHLRAAMI